MYWNEYDLINNEFVDELWNHIEKIKNLQILFWGEVDISRELINRMNASNNGNQICGIVDFGNKNEKQVKDELIIDIKKIQEISFDIIVITSDKEKETILRKFSEIDARKPQIVMAGTGHLDFGDKLYYETLKTSAILPRAFGYPNMLIHLYQSLLYIKKNNLKGNVAEFGVYKGGTAVFLARIMQSIEMKSRIFAFDTFHGFPKTRSVLDMYNDSHDEFFDYEKVTQYCKPFDIELIKGDINETYHRIKDTKLVLSFFDTDNYSPARNALELCYKQTVKGGVLAFDHYYCDKRWIYTLGERIAAEDFLADKNVINFYGTGIFIKME